MRSAGDIVLVSCYELGHQPLAVASPTAALRAAGFAPVAIDLQVDELDDAARAMLARARLVAIATPMHTALRLGVRVARRVRELNPAARICFYGLYAPAHEPHLRAAGADDVLGAEYEASLVALAQGVAPPAAGTRPVYVLPARDGLPPLDRYAKLIVAGERRVAGYTEASRGCLHMCRHCPIPPAYGGRFFVVPVDVVLADVRQQVAAGARHITFGDADFLNGPKHALAVARGLPDGVTFDCTVKVEHILAHREVWPELAARGCVFVVSAVESLSDHILTILDKGHTAADVVEALRIVRAAGISLRPTLVAFTPWTTIDDYLELCHFVARHGLEDEVDPVQLSIRLLVPPGSLLLDHPATTCGPLDPELLTHSWAHPDPRMDALQLEIAALVEQAAEDDEDPATTFARIHDRAAAVAGRHSHPAPRTSRKAAPPRLSEPWFC